ADGSPEMLTRIQRQRSTVSFAQQQQSAAINNLAKYERLLMRALLAGLVIGTLFVGLLLLYAGMRQLSKGRAASAYFLGGALTLALLFLCSLAGTFYLTRGPGLFEFAKKTETKRPAALPVAEAKDFAA